MQHFYTFLLIWQVVLFVIIVSNITKLLTDYLLTKIK